MTESYEWGSPSQRPVNGLFRSRSRSNFRSPTLYQSPSPNLWVPSVPVHNNELASSNLGFLTGYATTTSTTSIFSAPIGISKVAPPKAERETAAIGFRAWNIIIPGGPFLGAVSFTAVWSSNEPMSAQCAVNNSHAAPSVSCECGLHAWTSFARASMYIPRTESLRSMVVGACIGWGHVIQHGGDGWRAQYARPVAFLDTGLFEKHPHLEALAKRYNVPILPTRASLEMYAAEYGEALDVSV